MTYSRKPDHTRRIGLGIGFLLALLVSNFSTPVFAASMPKHPAVTVKTSHTVTLAISNEVLSNPGQGWVLYGLPSEQTAKTLAYARVGYVRYNWSDIEPHEGVYNWSRIDNDLNAWTAVGKKFAFGVMNANSSTPTNKYVTPQWVFDDGAHSIESWTYDNIIGVKGVQYIPVWDDPIFLRKVQDFVTALARRYDGNPEIAYIDIRSYGNWGVQDVNGLPHSVLLPKPGAQEHIQIYRSAFKHTQLIVPWGSPLYKSVYTWATGQHIGLRRDGLMVDSNGGELTLAARKAPIAFEFYSSYQWLKQRGFWNDSNLIKAVNVGEASYINMGGWGKDAQVFLAEKEPLIQELTNLMGFRLVLNSATIPNTITDRHASTIDFSWKNRGVAYMYQAASVAVALLNSSNHVVQKQWLLNVKPSTWQPGKTIVTSTTVTFTGVHAGTYKLAVGLFVRKTDSAPTYRIGNNGRTSNDWYVISSRVPVK
jgi:Domain of unknown function (DUF4832)/Beta-galactosidase